MRNLFIWCFKPLVANDLLWRLMKPMATFGRLLYYLRKLHEEEIIKKRLLEKFSFLFHNNEVLNGPFKGLKYPSINSVGSAIFPKLIGSYEKEIQEVIASFCNKKYSDIIDIGCAEGYYAVGFCLRIPEANVHAYDINEKARQLCDEMAKLNGVESHLAIKGLCTPKELEQFVFKGKGLIICDCEGFEIDLFNSHNIENLKNCDLLIELHDFKNIHISTTIYELFSQTHHLKVVKSIDDIEKTKSYSYQETKELGLIDKKILFSEHRPAIMEWLICLSKS